MAMVAIGASASPVSKRIGAKAVALTSPLAIHSGASAAMRTNAPFDRRSIAETTSLSRAFAANFEKRCIHPA